MGVCLSGDIYWVGLLLEFGLSALEWSLAYENSTREGWMDTLDIYMIQCLLLNDHDIQHRY